MADEPVQDRERVYFLVTTLAWLLVLLVVGYAIYDPLRMASAASQQHQAAIEDGARIYAQYCMVCHGPNGEGVVGKPLNRPDLQGDPATKQDVVAMLTQTITNGRPGSTVPHWVRLPDGSWASFTAMPAWGRSQNGPLDEQMVSDVVAFIMNGDFSLAGKYTPPMGTGTVSQEQAAKLSSSELMQKLVQQLPRPAGLDASTYARAQQLIAKYGCLSCHTIGSVGGRIGPDLTQVGSWGLDASFLQNWLLHAPTVKDRAPVYWSNFQDPFPVLERALGGTGGSQGALAPLPAPTPLEHPTDMPNFQQSMGMTPADAQTLADYLLHLK
ncbi:MAG: c-type cytochrome [Clostridia bacterium]|nr:c-type cytochrome [Clostridia bacterium]